MKTLHTYHCHSPAEPAAGLPGFNETISVTVEHGILAERQAEFDAFMIASLGEYFEARVITDKQHRRDMAWESGQSQAEDYIKEKWDEGILPNVRSAPPEMEDGDDDITTSMLRGGQ